MNAIELSEYLKPIVSACPLWKDKKLCMELIANPVAGGFTQKKLAAEHERVLADYSTLSKTKEQQCKSLTMNVYETSLTSSLDEYIQKIVGRAGMPEDFETFFLIVTAGGDGTSLEVQTALAKIAFDIGGEYSQIIKNRITVFRLPFGTGNDGSDGRTLRESLDLLSINSHFSLQKAIRVNCRTTDEQAENGKADRSLKVLPPWYAFNMDRPCLYFLQCYLSVRQSNNKNLQGRSFVTNAGNFNRFLSAWSFGAQNIRQWSKNNTG